MLPPCDLTQTAFLFSFFVNSAAQMTGTSPQLAQFLSMALGNGGTWTNGTSTYTVNGLIQQEGHQLIGGDWGITWGPAIFENGGDTSADNAMAVLYSPSQDTYVVAIAGTNTNSAYDWLFEDVQVGPKAMVNFPMTNFTSPPVGIAANAATPQITLATALGIYNLVANMTDQNNKNASLISYLTTLTPASATSNGKILFVGHSLGGALSATLPLQILSMIDNWGWTAKGGAVYAMPTAGPTPGNGKFAALWNTTFPATPVQNTASGNQVTSLNVPIANSLDLVPHAWTNIYAATQSAGSPVYFFDYEQRLFNNPTTLDSVTVTLANVPNTINKLATDIWVVASAASLAGKLANAAQLPSVKSLTASFPVIYLNDATQQFESYNLPTSNVTTLADFKTVLGTIHVWQYFPFFGITTSDLPHPVAALETSASSGQPAFASAEPA